MRFFPKTALLTAILVLSTTLSAHAADPAKQRLEQAGLVELTDLAPDVVLDIRYATPDNFTGQAVYPAARCFLRKDAAERLAAAQKILAAKGLGLKVFDCYRPISVQQKFWSLVPDERYVAKPVEKDGKWVEGSRHNRGMAVDVSLVDASGKELPMPTGYDDFSEKAGRSYAGNAPEAQANMKLLEATLAAQGFAPLPTEWWHFDGPGFENHELLDIPIN